SLLLALFFSVLTRPPPRATLFPYTTLFRSVELEDLERFLDVDRRRRDGDERQHRVALPDVILDPLAVDGDVAFEKAEVRHGAAADRKSTRLNSSHDQISYAVFCLKKKNPRP